jgi:hypothetical protein
MKIDSVQDSLILQCGKNASIIMLMPPVQTADLGTPLRWAFSRRGRDAEASV